MKRRVLALAGCLLIAATLLRASAERLERYEVDTSVIGEGPPLSSLHPPLLGILTLGHRALYDDFIYLWLLQYLMPEPQTPREPIDRLVKRIDAVLRLKPHIESIYLLSCFILGLEYKRPELCEKISILGLQVFPESWRIPMTQGYMLAFPLKEPLRAAFYYHLAASRTRSPPYVASLAKKLMSSQEWTPQDRQEVLKSIISIPNSESFKALLEKQ